MIDKTIGIASENTYRCSSKCHSSIPLTRARNDKSYAKNKMVLNYDANKLAILGPYINGTGQRDASMRLSLLDLPASKHFQHNISRHQALIGEKIRNIAQKEIDLALEMEIKETIVNEKGEEYYAEWMSKAKGDREKIGLTVSYDMGWNKRSSGHRYDLLPGHAFIIGAYTRQIIGCVVFSKTCAIFNMRKQKNRHADENGVTEVSNIEIEKIVEEEENSLNDNDNAIADAATNPSASASIINCNAVADAAT